MEQPASKVIKRKTYTTQDGKIYNITETAFTRSNIYKNIGNFVFESPELIINTGDSSEQAPTGVYIYQQTIQKNKGYKIYKQLYDPSFNGNKDDKLISKLRERENNIKLTQFPYGVVTLEGRIIGQEMPFYNNSITVQQYCENNNKRLKPTDIYIAIINIIKELYDNGIYYYDCHAKNFLILYEELEKNPNDISKIIKLVDFDEDFVDFDTITEDDKKRLFNKLCTIINLANQRFGLYNKLDKLICIQDFDDAYEQIEEMKRKIKC